MAFAAHPWPAHDNLAAMEADLPLRRTPAVANAFPAAMVRTDKPLRVLAQHLLNHSDASRQTEALERTVYVLPSRFKAGYQHHR